MSLLLSMFHYPFIVRAFVVGILVSLCASLLGVSLVLKRYSMIGDGLSHVSFGALAVAVNRMAKSILADGRIDLEEAAQLQRFLEGVEGQEEFRKALADARADGVITMEESAGLENFLRRLIK